MQFSKKRLIAVLAGVLALMLVGYTLAYFTSSSKIDNLLHTDSYGLRTIEEFTPEQEMEPGVSITKAVGVSNSGDYPLVVRVKFDEKWSRKVGGVDTAFKTISSTGPIATVNSTTLNANQVDATDGVVPTTPNEETVVYKKLNTTDWTYGDDGYYYFNTTLGAHMNTSNVLESIALAANADLGKHETIEYYSTANKSIVGAAKTAYEAALANYTSSPTAANKATMEARYADLETAYDWKAVKPADVTTITYQKSDTHLESGKYGYSDADYTLTITTEVCQATKAAVIDTWTMGTTKQQSILTGWGIS